MTYRELIDAAKHVPPGDTGAASRWLLDLAGVLKAGELMPAQRAYLYRLRRVWRVRAQGRDARWNIFGSMPGANPSKVPVVKPAPPLREQPTVSAIPLPVVPVIQPLPQVIPSKPASPLSSLLDKYGR